MKDLFEYFRINWDRKPHPVIDHSLRIERLEDGSFHFYIHPSYTDGITTDFVISEDEFKKRI
jgi:hypothetical protein